MVKVPTWMGGKKEEPVETLEEKLDKLGVHFNTDRFFGDRLANIETELTELLSDNQIDEMQISATRKRLLKMTMKRLRYAWGNIPFGKARENMGYARGMTAARKLLLRAQKAIMSDAEEKQIENYCNSIFARIDMLVGFTFDSENVSINKSVIIQSQILQTPPPNTPQEREPSLNFSQIAKQKREERLAQQAQATNTG